MFRLVTTRIISTGRIIIKSPGCLSYPPHRFLPNSVSQSNGDVTTSTMPLVDRNKNEASSRTNKSPIVPKIYTRRGDRGTSTLLSSGANRLSKDSLIFDVLGTIDELSSTIENIQCALFEIGSCVAAENCSSHFEFNDAILIKHLEEDIDKMTAELPELRNFILPGGSSKIASHVHFSRAVCRRCERLLTKWTNNKIQENQSQQETIMGIYLNRLSDYLFTLGRYMSSIGLLVSRLRYPFFRRYLTIQTSNVKPKSDLPSNLQKSNDPTVMPILNPNDLPEAEQIYIKRFEERHMRNVERRTRERRRARIIGLSFGALAIGIYIYTIKRVRQETFLDDFDVPEPPPQKKAIEHE
ncbi:unnamed protein product [Rotaria socialis]|uniref:Corrinoid adenosyltransferase n=1 Tax=Rotaria socialis TaxID=392032 RepID=A0A820ST83_9BILA|nr:unnamed protein product [Rotaria socialis]